jgi:ubiquinone/menaquinone biosynthesis C-methylase UbiE
VAEKRIEFHLGSSDRLPFDDQSFDKVFAVHTVYFWQAPLDHLAEARRALKPGGRFVLGFRPAEDAGFQATYPSETLLNWQQTRASKASTFAGIHAATRSSVS